MKPMDLRSRKTPTPQLPPKPSQGILSAPPARSAISLLCSRETFAKNMCAKKTATPMHRPTDYHCVPPSDAQIPQAKPQICTTICHLQNQIPPAFTRIKPHHHWHSSAHNRQLHKIRVTPLCTACTQLRNKNLKRHKFH